MVKTSSDKKNPSRMAKSGHPDISDFERIAQKMYTQNLALAETNRELSILRTIDMLILEASRNLPQLSGEISNAIIESTPYAMIAIFSLNNYNERFLSLQGYSFSSLMQDIDGVANSAHMLPGLRMDLDGMWLSSKTRNLILSMDGADAMKRAETFGLGRGVQTLFEVMNAHFGLHSFYLSKFKVRDSPSGLMLVGLEETMPKIDDIELIEQLVETTGIALESRLLYEENQRFLKELQIANDHLKELDAAKDEFISMVSHQLRTPLTSIKGFMSMVLDGDTGSITGGQRRMLQQAFDGSQRMVYLIADLLNASRLRSGKLMIMRHPTNLPEVVSSELEQLKKAAELRRVKFTYKKPGAFPTVLLDETKIRQVVMNFLDNALYYTPEGGRVRVELKATAKTIEYTVTDTGMGVPESEQPMLFTKFYRAGNARKMRPEGTGIGIYMAKKIIIAEGGSIIFKSKEGKGSTFGFMFPREKIELKPGQETESNEQVYET